MCFITHLNNNKFHIKVYLVISSELDLQSSKCLGVPSHPMFPYYVFKIIYVTVYFGIQLGSELVDFGILISTS